MLKKLNVQQAFKRTTILFLKIMRIHKGGQGDCEEDEESR